MSTAEKYILVNNGILQNHINAISVEYCVLVCKIHFLLLAFGEFG